MIVQEMTWEQAKSLVERRLNKLAMCKRGAIATDINKQYEALGDPPEYTKEEKDAIKAGVAKKMQKALTPTVAQCRNMDVHSLIDSLKKRAKKVTQDLYVHPGKAAYMKKREMISSQSKAREATLDGEFQDVLDEFLLGTLDLVTFPSRYDELEAKEW